MKGFMSNFIREQRYYVLKISDACDALSPREQELLKLLHAKVGLGRAIAGKPDTDFVVVEKDWPEYEMVWASIQDRTPKGTLGQ
jgi:hypothetical protein